MSASLSAIIEAERPAASAAHAAWIATWLAANDPYGACRAACDAMLLAFPELRLVRGHYLCPLWGDREHWWLVDPGGAIVDPTAAQFPTRGHAPVRGVGREPARADRHLHGLRRIRLRQRVRLLRPVRPGGLRRHGRDVGRRPMTWRYDDWVARPWDVRLGDSLDVLADMADASVDAVVTDPPYGFRMMGARWDYDVPTIALWAEVLRVLKPGGHLLAFAGARTQHRMAVRIEDAGFEIRDMIAWVYGKGMPKSLDVSKALDKRAGREREVVGRTNRCIGPSQRGDDGIGTFKETNWATSNLLTAPASDEAKRWAGWGTALKPALEPITVARKPLIGTVATNVLTHDVGGLNIDGCRVPWGADAPTQEQWNSRGAGGKASGADGYFNQNTQSQKDAYASGQIKVPPGRWPANLIHDGSDEVLAAFPEAPGQQGPAGGDSPGNALTTGKVYGDMRRSRENHAPRGAPHGPHSFAMTAGPGPRIETNRSAARFFYCSKASPKERGDSTHPTMKPLALMRYLCRLVAPPGALVLDPFAGSGTTGVACAAEGLRFLGVEREPEHYATAWCRVAAAYEQQRAVADDARTGQDAPPQETSP